MKVRIRVLCLIVAALVCPALMVYGQSEAPREETLILGSDLTSNVAADEIRNPYLPAAQRSPGMTQLLEETLFYTNCATNELMPWLATGYDANDDFTEYTISLRDGVTWDAMARHSRPTTLTSPSIC